MAWLEDRGLTAPKFYKRETIETPLSVSHNTPVYLFAITTASDLAHAAAQQLLKKIIEATKIDVSQLQILTEETLERKLELFTPQVCLCFGISEPIKPDAEMIFLPSVSSLLTDPAGKRLVWDTLQSLMSRPNFPKQTLHS